MMRTTVAIIGAGPYGLSVAAHLGHHRVPYRILGQPMDSWRRHMPEGMCLKSEGFASSLSAPPAHSTLRHFCERNGLEYRDRGFPVPLETLVAYGLNFQKEFVPELEDKRVAVVEPYRTGFAIRTGDGETFTATSVVMAVGVSHFKHVPSVLASLPASYMSHSSDHHNLEHFHGKDVTVIGGGASALDLAGLLSKIGVSVRLVLRRPPVWGVPPEVDRPLWKRLRFPESKLGVGLKLRLFEKTSIFYHLPLQMRHRIVRTWLGPAGGWFMRGLVEDRVPYIVGYSVRDASPENGRLRLTLGDSQDQSLDLETDHVIAATGYRVDLGRLTLLSEDLRSQLKSVADAPVLSKRFESTVSGLHFVGLASATSFGPVMRFLAGTDYTARTLAKHFA